MTEKPVLGIVINQPVLNEKHVVKCKNFPEGMKMSDDEIKDICLVVKNSLGTFTSVPHSCAEANNFFNKLNSKPYSSITFDTGDQRPVIIGRDLIANSAIFLVNINDK